VPELAREVGFARADETARVTTPFGSAAYWKAIP
jgi:hypothetical protein